MGENDEVGRYRKSDLGKGRPPQTTERPLAKKQVVKKNKGDNPNYIHTGAKGNGAPQIPQGPPNWVPRNRRQKGKGSK